MELFTIRARLGPGDIAPRKQMPVSCNQELLSIEFDPKAWIVHLRIDMCELDDFEFMLFYSSPSGVDIF